MSNLSKLSSHIPGLAGGIETLTGSLVVDTGLKTMQTFVCTMKADTITVTEESKVTWEELPQAAGETVKVTIYSWKGGTVLGGTAGDTARVLVHLDASIAWCGVRRRRV